MSITTYMDMPYLWQHKPFWKGSETFLEVLLLFFILLQSTRTYKFHDEFCDCSSRISPVRVFWYYFFLDKSKLHTLMCIVARPVTRWGPGRAMPNLESFLPILALLISRLQISEIFFKTFLYFQTQKK